jgi:DNA invertase Pin-like site-specific DNA recombinase
VNAGLARARAKGVWLRPRTSAKIEQRIRELAVEGIGKQKTARMLGVGVSVVERVLAAA